MMEGRPSIAARQAYNISCQQTEAVTPGRPTVNFFFLCFLLVFCPGLCGAVGWTKCFPNKSSGGVLGLPLGAVEETSTRAEMSKVCEWNETADTSSPFIRPSEMTLVPEYFIYCTCRSLSLVTCGFRSLERDPSITQTVSCESFARLRALSLNPCGFFFLHICSPAWVQRETLFSRLAEGRYVRVCCDCCLHYHYSFLPWNVNLMF